MVIMPHVMVPYNAQIFYGHKEGDLTRFPEPTRVLKYPHVTMTGPGQRGYVASASSFYTTSSNPAYQAFDNNTCTVNGLLKMAQNYTHGGSLFDSGSTEFRYK